MKKVATLAILALILLPLSVLAGSYYHKSGGKGYMKQMDVVDMAAHTGQFNTLVAALQAAGLEETLRGDGPFTVLAPNDTAFAKLPQGTVEDLLKPENKEKLVSILTYHVIPGKVYSKEVVNLGSGKTVNGKEVQFKIDGDNVYADAAQIVHTDIKASNGVIHIIDSVIMPM